MIVEKRAVVLARAEVRGCAVAVAVRLYVELERGGREEDKYLKKKERKHHQ
jgi:hypothetical protein